MPLFASVLVVVWNIKRFIFKLTTSEMQLNGGKGLLKAVLATRIAAHIPVLS